MSHEIRTPLTAILGFNEVILSSSREPETLDAAATIQRNGRHLMNVINDILDLSKIEAGKLHVELRACNPYQVVAEVVSLLRVQAVGKGLALRVSCDGPLPQSIQTDAARLRQILLNLVGNAIKFTELGGVDVRLSLEDRPVTKTLLRCDVIDTGIGMTQRQMTEIFQPFQQVDTSASRRFGGTGLGLAISNRLATMLGGDLTAESTSGCGSTFSLRIATGPLHDVPLVLPTAEAFAGQSEQPQADRERSAQNFVAPRLRGRVLLAEDGPDNQRLISFLLRKAGAEVVLAENGQQAMEKVLASFPVQGRRYSDEHAPIALVLMDIQMPVMDGLQATRRLRQAGYQGPILALTAHAMEQDVQRCLDAGCNAHLAKPIDRQNFLSTVARFLAQEPVGSATPQPAGAAEETTAP
jgi:CheY-like chemotaxis protein